MSLFKCVSIILFGSLCISCNTNDFSSIYQKELIYDGKNIKLDTLTIETYSASITGDSLIKNKLYNSTTKWYDLNGYNSMTKSILYTHVGERETLEQITRDKNSLPIARDIIITSPNTEAAVTLSRLKRRKDGKEEWLFRHYLDPQKYIEDESYVFYDIDRRITKKKIGALDSLNVVEVDIFDNQGRLVQRMPSAQERELPHIMNYYNKNGYLDSVVAKIYKDNNPQSDIFKKYTESYKYEFDEANNIIKSYTFYNDSLTFIADFKYAFRK